MNFLLLIRKVYSSKKMTMLNRFYKKKKSSLKL